MERARVYEVIDGERGYQDSKWPEGTGCDRSVGEEILCMEDILLDARKAWQAGDDNDPIAKARMMDYVRKTAAVAVRCMELHGAPRR